MDPLNLKKILLAVGSLIAIITVFSSYTIVRPGYTGVIFNRWTGALYSTPQGMALKVPFITDVQAYPIALRTYTMVERSNEGSSAIDDSIDLPTLEGQHIRQDISITYNTTPDKASDVFRSFKGADIDEIEKSFIRRTTITVAQNTAGQMSLSEVISSKRSDIQKSIQENLSIELTKMGFYLDKVNLGASHLPKVIEEQMQQKMAAQQSAQQAQYELQKQELLAKAAIAKARGESEANRLLQLSLTAQLIQKQSIEKWNGVLPQVSSNAIPFISIGK